MELTNFIILGKSWEDHGKIMVYYIIYMVYMVYMGYMGYMGYYYICFLIMIFGVEANDHSGIDLTGFNQ